MSRKSEVHSASPPDAGRPEQRITTLQWAVGTFCAFNGALMVIAPHQFSGPIWSVLQGQQPWVGSIFLLAGVALIGCVVMGAPWRWVVASHFAAATMLLALVYNLALVGLWPGAVFQIVFALGTVLAPFVTRLERPGRPNTGDFFALVFGAVNATYGLMMLLLPDQFRSPVYDPIRPYLMTYGAGFLAASAALALAQFRPGLPRPLYWTAHLAILVPSAPYALATPIPSGSWAGIVIYCGLAPLVASLPWTGQRLRSIDPRSFSVRLALLLALTAVVPLIVTVGIATNSQQRAERDLAFGLLLGAVLLAVVAGTLMAERLTSPLAALARATSLLARGDGEVPLPRGGSSEIQGLVATFREMRDDMVARAAEREHLLASLTEANEHLVLSSMEVQRQAAELDIVFASLADPVIVFDSQGRPVRTNPAAEAKYGVDPVASGIEGFVRKAAIRTPEGEPIGAEELPGIQAIREKRPGAKRLVTTNSLGEEVIVHVVASPLIVNGQVHGAVGVWRDITERERLLAAEQEARAEAQRRAAELRSVLDNMVDAVFVCDTEGLVTLTNGAGLRLLGLEDSPEAARPIGEIREPARSLYVNGTAVPSERHPLARALAGEILGNEHLVIRDPRTGKDVYLRISAAPLRSGTGSIVGAVSVARDVTELTELDRLKDQFIAVAAHELKTPVAIMKGHAQALVRRAESVPPGRRRMVDAISRGADRIDGVVNDLLDISRLQSGRLELTLESVDLGALVQDVLDRMVLDATRHRLQAMVAEPVVVRGDHGRLEQVVVNLLDNAIRYSPKGGDVEVEVTVQGQDAVVSVRDQGVGIPGEKQARIFERFYRAHTGTPYDYGGMGVSLYISREIASRHGGTMEFESEEGVGSSFRLMLPIARKDGGI